MWNTSQQSRPTRRGPVVLPAFSRSRSPRAAHLVEATDGLDMPYWFSHSGRVRRRSTVFSPRRVSRLRGRPGR